MKTIKTLSKFLLILFLVFILIEEFNNDITETIDIDPKIDLSDTMVFYN